MDLFEFDGSFCVDTTCGIFDRKLPDTRQIIERRRNGETMFAGRGFDDVPLGRDPSSAASSSSSPETSSKGFREDLRGSVPARGTLESATPRLLRMGILAGEDLGVGGGEMGHRSVLLVTGGIDDRAFVPPAL